MFFKVNKSSIFRNYASIVLLIVGTSQIATQYLGFYEIKSFLHRLYLSPMPYPFIGLPRNHKSESIYHLKICSGQKCQELNYLDALQNLNGPHRYRAMYYLLPLERGNLTEKSTLMLRNLICDFSRNAAVLKLDSKPTSVKLGSVQLDCF